MDVINAKSNTYPFVEVVIYSEILRTNCRVNQSRFSRQGFQSVIIAVETKVYVLIFSAKLVER